MINNTQFISICKKPQMELKDWLWDLLKSTYEKENFGIFNSDGYLYAQGDIPVILTAHMDTVHKEPVKDVVVTHAKNGDVISSPQGIGGDDRCGIAMIVEIINQGYRPFIVFCEDEEIGGVGSNKFVKEMADEIELTKATIKYIIELDRANAIDAVYYECGNEDFQKYITDVIGYEKDYGTFSDCCHLAPEYDLACVNLSCGYYKAHTTDEYVDMEEMNDTLSALEMLLEDCVLEETERFDYQEDMWGKYGSYYGSYYDNYYNNKYNYSWDNDDDEEYESLYGVRKSALDKAAEEIIPEKAVSGNDDEVYRALGKFFMDNPTITFNDILNLYEKQ